MGWESKPSSVPDGHLSRPQRDRPRRRLRGGSRLPASASNLLAADSEIAAGRIALFTPAVDPPVWSLLLSRGMPRANLDCRRAVAARLPGFHRAPSLCAARTFLWRRNASDHPCPLHASVVNVRARSMRGDADATSALHHRSESAVPKGRFELPRGYPHYALNVARLPVPPLRLVLRPPSRGRSRPPDSNRRPAVYETAALPTELGRHAIHPKRANQL